MSIPRDVSKMKRAELIAEVARLEKENGDLSREHSNIRNDNWELKKKLELAEKPHKRTRKSADNWDISRYDIAVREIMVLKQELDKLKGGFALAINDLLRRLREKDEKASKRRRG